MAEGDGGEEAGEGVVAARVDRLLKRVEHPTEGAMWEIGHPIRHSTYRPPERRPPLKPILIGIAIGGEWWRLLTGAFLHGGWLHIAFNMYVLFALGPTLERILGHGRFLLLYLLHLILQNLLLMLRQ